MNWIGHAFKISIVNLPMVIEVPRSLIKSLDYISLIVMVKIIHENKSATRGAELVPIGIPTICLYNLVLNLI